MFMQAVWDVRPDWRHIFGLRLILVKHIPSALRGATIVTVFLAQEVCYAGGCAGEVGKMSMGVVNSETPIRSSVVLHA